MEQVSGHVFGRTFGGGPSRHGAPSRASLKTHVSEIRACGLAALAAGMVLAGVARAADDPRSMKVLYAEKRTALMIGNATYTSAPLANPVHDAEAMARLLEQRKFDVRLLRNADQQQMEAAIEDFGQRLGASGVGLFFYAGHGMQIDGHNYLLPVGAAIDSERDVKYKAVNVGTVLGKMEDAGNRLNLVILDACRDNPFARSFRTKTTGLAQMDAPSGTLIAYSTAPGKVAADGGDASNSVYTRYLLEQLGVPGQELSPAFRQVRTKVLATTGNKQTPWESTSLTGEFYLTPIDMLDENLRLTKEQLERLQNLQREQAESEARLKKLETDKEAEMAAFAKQIADLQARMKAGTAAGSASLSEIVSLGERRAATAAELAEAKRKAEVERRRLDTQVAALKAQEQANRKQEYEKAYAMYTKVCELVTQGHLSAAEHVQAWQLLCRDWGVKDAGAKPAELVWNDADGTVLLVSLAPAGVGRVTSGAAKPGDAMSVDLGGGVKMELVWIEPGTFTMGSPASEADRNRDERQHRVTLTKGYWMGKYEVTQEQWERVMGSNPSNFKGAKNPVEQVSWDDCQAFIRKLNGLAGGAGGAPTGYAYRLPTEAEWEYACRAGTTTPFHYGSRLDAGMANFDGNHPYGGVAKGEYRQTTMKVGGFQPNAFGLYDMHGNVWEWCEDWHGDYPAGSVTDPKGAISGSARALRGGSWNAIAQYCRSAYRFLSDPSSQYSRYGLRVVLSR